MTKSRKRKPMKTNGFSCSNRNCERVFTDPMVVYDVNSEVSSAYYGCPFCLTKIESGSKRRAKRRTNKTGKTKLEPQPTQSEERIQQCPSQKHECPYHFGYLSEDSRGEEFPDECMICPSMLECMRSKVKVPNGQ